MQRVYLKYEDDTIVAGQQPMLKILGVSKPTFNKWIKEGLPLEMRGKTKVFKLDEVQKWVNQNVDYLAELERIKTQAQIKEIEIRTAHRKLKLAEDKRELMPIDELTKSQVSLVELLKAKDNLFYTRCTDPELKRAIDKHLKEKWDSVKDELQKIYDVQTKEAMDDS